MAVDGGQQPEYDLRLHKGQSGLHAGRQHRSGNQDIYDAGTAIALIFPYGWNTQRLADILLRQPVQHAFLPNSIETLHDNHGLAVKQQHFGICRLKTQGTAQRQAEPFIPWGIGKV